MPSFSAFLPRMLALFAPDQLYALQTHPFVSVTLASGVVVVVESGKVCGDSGACVGFGVDYGTVGVR